MRAGRDDEIAMHFTGAVVYVEQGLSSVTNQEALLVIDGQQRLTTCTLMIAALAEHFKERGVGELLGSFSYKKLRNYYLLNPDEEGERRFKLILSETDKETLLALLQGDPAPAPASLRILENYRLLKHLVDKHSSELEAVCSGLSKLSIVDISLDRNNDDPQLIFESMNSTGLELNQSDLIRNFILMGLEPTLQSEVYRTYWRPMEMLIGQKDYAVHFDAFMRHYLTAKTGALPNIREVYDVFKAFSRKTKKSAKDLAEDVYTYATHYCAIALGKEPDPVLDRAFKDLRELKVDVSYPFLLAAYHHYHEGAITRDGLVNVVRLVESYVFLRAVCSIPTGSMNRTFTVLEKSLDKDNYVESAQAALLSLPTYRRFPRVDEFQRDLKIRDMYNFRSRYWLRRLENNGRRELAVLEDYTIEHILPQNSNLSPQWQKELGPDWQRVQGQWLHTIGNLTLTAYNSEYSDKPFAFKRSGVVDRDGNPVGLAHSPLRLNSGLSSVYTWDEPAIQARAARLAAEAVKVWAIPSLPESSWQNLPRPEYSRPQYSLADHPSLRDLYT